MLRRLTLATAAITLAVGLAAPAQAKTLKFLVSWGANNTMAHLPAAQLKKNVEAMDVDLELEISGPETVPPAEQLAPASTGVFDMIYTYPAYHSKGITIATNAMEADMDKMRSSGVFDFMDKYMQENHNLKLLANVSIGDAGYHCYLREPLDDDGMWNGRKIRSVPTYDAVIKLLGGTPVTAMMPEVYSSLEKGVFDGACAPQSVFRATKHYEVAPYRTEPTFGSLVSYIAVNLDTWNGLTDAEREALNQAAIKTEKDTIRIGNETIGGDLEAMAAEGVEVTTFPPDIAKKVSSTYYDSIWGLTAKCCGEETANELRGIARDAGLTN
jgi:TRAP-type C4-dicarboxylate transport system substrate-binding protein